MHKIPAYAIHLGIFIFPATILTFNDVKDVSIALILLGALSLLGVSWRSWKTISPEIKLVAVAFVLFALWALFSTFVVGQYAAEGKARVSRYFALSYVLLLVPAYYYIKGIDFRVIAAGFALGCVVVFIYAVYQYHVPGEWGRRAYGDTHPNRYGGICMSMAVIVMSYAIFYKTKRSVRIGLFMLALLGVAGSYYSGTRGSWIALPPAVLLMAVLYAWQKQKWKEAVAGLLIILLVFLGVGLFFGADKQVMRTHSSVTSYLDGKTSSSLGLRFEMFRMASYLFSQQPVTGVGVGNYHQSVIDIIESDAPPIEVNPYIKNYHNPHNAYFLSLAERGSIGFVLFLATLLCPAYAFYRQHRQTRSASSVAGLSVIACYSVVGLSIGLFEHTAFMQFYLLAILALLCARDSVSFASAQTSQLP